MSEVKPMNVVVVEDDKYQAAMLSRLLNKHYPDAQLQTVLHSVSHAVDYFNNNTHPDLVFMDVELGQEKCFDIFPQISLSCPVIFTTSHTHYSLDAFYHNGIHYLVKPITEGRLKEGMQKYLSLRGSLPLAGSTDNEEAEKPAYEKLLIKSGVKHIPLTQEEIELIFTTEGYVYLHTVEGQKYLVDHYMYELYAMLNPDQFFRINRQYIVHKDLIGHYSGYTRGRLKVELTKYVSEPVLISFKRRHEFEAWVSKAYS